MYIILRMCFGYVIFKNRRIAVPLLIFEHKCVMCGFHDSLLSISTPKNVVTGCSWIITLLRIISNFGLPRLKENNIVWVLVKLIMSLFAIKQSTTLFHSLCKIICNWLKSLQLYIVVVSSANWTNWTIDELFSISLTYKRNNNGPIVEHGGIPIFTVLTSECMPLTFTFVRAAGNL